MIKHCINVCTNHASECCGQVKSFEEQKSSRGVCDAGVCSCGWGTVDVDAVREVAGTSDVFHVWMRAGMLLESAATLLSRTCCLICKSSFFFGNLRQIGFPTERQHHASTREVQKFCKHVWLRGMRPAGTLAQKLPKTEPCALRRIPS